MAEKSFKSIRKARQMTPDGALKFAKQALRRIGASDDGEHLRAYLLSIQMETGSETDPNRLIQQSARRQFASDLLTLLDGTYETEKPSTSRRK